MTSLFQGRAAGYLVAVFLAGALAGGGIGYSAGRKAMFRPPPDSVQMAAHLTEKLRKEINLTPKQAEQVRPLIQQACVEMESIHGKTVQRACEIMKATNRRIEPLLSEQQRDRLRTIEAEREASMLKFARGQNASTNASSPPPLH